MKQLSASIRRPIAVVLTIAALALAVTACGSSDEEAYVEGTVEELYNTGMDSLLAGDYDGASQMFDEVERQHPYSVWATKAQLMAAYAQYSASQYEDALNALDRFIQLHPGNRDIAYAYYLRALCYYEQVSDVKRDQKMTEFALDSFDELVRRFPNTKYASDAREKIDLTRDHLAGKEMDIGRYYLRQDQHLAAINRFRQVVEEYDTTTHVPEALHRLVEAYTALGLTQEAQKSAAVLGYNFPDSPWYVASYQLVNGDETYTAGVENDEGSFWGWLF